MPVDISAADFDTLVDDAIDSIPQRFWDQIDNVIIHVEDEPPPDLDPDTLGVYDGIPVTERDDYAGYLPDRVTIFRGPLCRFVDTYEDLVKEVRITVIHEIGHYFGFDDEQLHSLGWA